MIHILAILDRLIKCFPQYTGLRWRNKNINAWSHWVKAYSVNMRDWKVKERLRRRLLTVLLFWIQHLMWLLFLIVMLVSLVLAMILHFHKRIQTTHVTLNQAELPLDPWQTMSNLYKHHLHQRREDERGCLVTSHWKDYRCSYEPGFHMLSIAWKCMSFIYFINRKKFLLKSHLR